MIRPQNFTRPESMAEGEHYLLRISSRDTHIPVFALVNFVGYTPCPAVVVVKDARNDRFSCERVALFRLNDGRQS